MSRFLFGAMALTLFSVSAGNVWAQSTVATPVLDPVSGSSATSFNAIIKEPTSGASIYYTLDGTTPTTASASIASGGTVTISKSETVNVVATKSGYTTSAMASATYELTGAVAAGTNTTLALRTDGTLWAWGANGSGALGDGTTINRTIPEQISSLSGVTAIATGGSHSLATKSDGTLWSWGNNTYDQVGDGTTTNRTSPVQVTATGLNNMVDVAAGFYHSLALQSNGTVWAWGINWSGQLGDGTNSTHATPEKITSVSGITDLSAGYEHSMALKSDGTVWVWGLNTTGQLGDGTITNRSTPEKLTSLSGIVAIAAGYEHSLALQSNGTVWAWGYNGSGQLGNGTTTESNSPVQVSGLTNVVAIAAGDNHSIAVESNGTVWVWGSNSTGQLGDGTTAGENSPEQVAGLSSAVAVAGGTKHTVVLRSDGSIYAWGGSDDGQLGIGVLGLYNSPIEMPVLSNVTGVAGCGTDSGSNSLAVKADGTLWGWGDNGNGQVGTGTTTNQNVPQQISLTGVSAVSTYWSHTLALLSNGTIYGWGTNTYGQVGDGTTTQRNSPVHITGVSGMTAVAAGSYHSLGLKSDGTIWVWGGNWDYQLGDGTGTNRSAPEKLPTLSGMTTIAAGYGHSMAIKSDQTLWVWGLNGTGQLGDGTITNHSTPEKITSLSGVTAIAAGYGHTLALESNGTVWAWGLNSNGQVGNGTTAQQATPVQLTGLSNIVAIWAGDYCSEALQSNGTVWAWGLNTSGQLADGTTNGQNSPEQISAMAGVTALTQGMALKQDGTLLVWGDNADGQLGIGNFGKQTSPVLVGDLNLIQLVPTVSISNPANGATLALGQTTNFQSSLTDSAGTITSVAYFQEGIQVGQSTSSPFALNITSLTWGSADFTAVATDSNGAHVLSATITVNTPYYTVAAAVPTFSPGTGTYSTGPTVTISSTTPNATIYYTTNGSTPVTTGSSPSLSLASPGSISVATGETIKAIAGAVGYLNSAVGSATYAIQTNPVISSGTTAGGTVGTAFNYTITASNSPTSFNAVGLPSGLSINTATGVISGTPTTTGTSSVNISATSASGTGTATLTLTIHPPAPAITSLTTASGMTGTAFSYTITASNSPTSFTATGLPSGLSINTSTGAVVGTLTSAGTSSVTLSATNAGGTATATLTVTITPRAPVISSGTTTSGTVGIAFSYTITASNSPTSFNAAGLPPGLTVNAATGAISGTPTTAGTSSVSLSATNAGGTGTATLTLTVNASPVISNGTIANGTTGTTFSYTITASNSPTGFNATGLPSGFNINTSTGVISGISTIAGTSTVTISATNATGTGSATLIIVVQGPVPTGLPTTGLSLWLRADAGVTTVGGSPGLPANNTLVTSIVDQTGAYTLSNGSSAWQPTYIANDFNGKPGLRFDGSKWLNSSASLGSTLNQDMTIVTVGTSIVTNSGYPATYALYLGQNSPPDQGRAFAHISGNQVFDTQGSSCNGGAAPPLGAITEEIATMDPSLTNVTFFRNGTQVATGTVSGVQNLSSGITMGAAASYGYGNNGWQGDILEQLVYNHKLTATEIQQVDAYLANKYGFYSPNATWLQTYSATVQAEIVKHQWNEIQANAYVAVQTNNPTLMSNGLTIWYRADSGVTTQGGTPGAPVNNNIVTSVADQLGNYPLNQSYWGQLPTYVANDINGMPALRFSPVQSLSNSNSIDPALNADITIVSVGMSTNGSGFSLYLGANSVAGANRGFSYNGGYEHLEGVGNGGGAPPQNDFVMEVASLNPTLTQGTFFQGLTETFTTAASTFVNVSNGVTLGGKFGSNSSSDYWQGDLLEVMVYDHQLSVTETEQVEFFLASKYNLSISVPAPTITPDGGSYTSTSTVSFSSIPSPAVIRYTLDGSSPTSTSLLYSGAFTLTQSCPVNAAIFLNNIEISSVASAQFYVGDSGDIGISDAWQSLYFGRTGINPNSLTPGGSGLTNLQAYLYGYNPNLYSSNGDGLSDLVNYELGYSTTDTDINGYGLTNAQQIALGLDPFDTGVNPVQATIPPGSPGDRVPPSISLASPQGATLLP